MLVFLLLLVAYGYFSHYPGWNGNSRLGLTMAIVKEGRLSIDTFAREGGPYPTGDIASYAGHFYTDKAIGSSLVAAAAYYPIHKITQISGHKFRVWVETWLITFLVIGIPSAITGTLIFILALYLSKSRIRSFFVTLAIALGTMLFPFSVIFFGHTLAAFFLFSAFFLIYQIRIKPPGENAGGFRLFLIGLLLGLALLTETPTALIILILVGYYFHVLHSRNMLKRFTAWLLPFVGGSISVILILAYNLKVYGEPFALGYAYLVDPYYREQMSKNIMGIGLPSLRVLFYETLHPAQGILWQSPVLLMTIVGGYQMWRKREHRAELLVAGLVSVSYLVLMSGYFEWWGGHSFAVRHLIPMLPFLSLPLIFVPRKWFPVFIFLAVISTAQMLIVAASRATTPDKYLEQIDQLGFFEYSTIYSDCLPRLLSGKFARNLGQAWLGLKTWASLAPLIAVLLGVIPVFAIGNQPSSSAATTNVVDQ